MSRYVVHTVPGSPYGRAVMAMLEEKRADWQLSPLVPGEHTRQPHLDRHPFGRMPVLEFGGECLYETQAILRYLDEALPGLSFTPTAPEARYRMNQLMGICDAYVFPEGARQIVFQRVIGPAIIPGFAPDEQAIAEAMPRSHTIFAELSRILGGQPWFGGESPSLADLMLGPQLELYRRTPEWAELAAGRPNLSAWLDRLEDRPSMTATLWERLLELPAPQAA